MKKTFSILSVVFIIALILCLVPTVAMAANASENTTEFLGGTGEANNPYIISNKTHLSNVKLSYEVAFPINIIGDEHIIQMYSCTHYRSNYIKSQASSNNFESSFYQV